MGEPIGIEGAGEYARQQLDAAWRDPRLDREQPGAYADFWDAMEEAERVRRLGQSGLHELTLSLDREEAKLGVQRDADELDEHDRRSLQAAWERAEWARAELANETPHANAQALISMMSALDAMVEESAKFWRTVQIDLTADEFLTRANEQMPEAAAVIPAPAMEQLKELLRQKLDETAPKALRPAGTGVERYEKPLRRIGLGAPTDRPIPDDLNAALTELISLRHVLVHRAGRIDVKALKDAPTLTYAEGELVRLSRADYRTYSAAVRCYAGEVGFRLMRNWPEVTGAKDGPNLAQWRSYVTVNV